jgi:hypothetical protein
MKVLAAVVLAGTLLAQTPEVTRSEQPAGPFVVSGHKLLVIREVNQIPGAGPVDPEFGQTVAAVRVVDETGAALFERTFPHEIQSGRFAKTTAVHTETLAGRQGSGLLLTYSVLPAVPRGGISWQLLGFVGEKLVPFSKPLAAYGDLAGQEPGRPARTNWDEGLEADMLTFRVWTGNF